ncbi:beta-lactamase family protein [Curtobacterium sp. Csp1]|uniref:serine hydrolase domain-containing protein n=1 Tax=unclassified Curtobacterium TaxID=257496 RepID=UPI001597DDCE|nr:MULTISPECIES: serine hydrolase domain-containing protein [unclassified Curtobacterium]QKS13701.1 beta-lactamase family protein [Curtobacterium sp. csp3]QKS20744.1 beta-lactamase family protein [Curtobacterium sp. Csp1]
MSLPDDLLAEVDALFRDRVAARTAPSSVWGVFDRDGLVASGGHGDRGDGRAPDADTVYRIASCTKSVTAATLLTLVAEGRADLDAPITDAVPAFAEVTLPSRDAPVPTLRMLLTMAGGFPTDDPWADRQESIADAELDDVLRGGLLFDSVPGTRFAYSNTGYALLGRAVAVAAGTTFLEAATSRVLAPLGLDDTVFRAEDARGYVVTGQRDDDGSWTPQPMTGPGAFSSIGGLFSTVRDLARWARHLASATSTTPEPGPLSPADRRLMQQAMRVVPPSVVPTSTRATAYGFGLFVEQDPRFGELVSHSGGYPGFSAHMRWSVEHGLGVVAFENATQAKVSAAADRALDVVLERIPGQPSPVAPGVERTAAAARDAQRSVTTLLQQWADAPQDPAGDALADRVCSPNVPMDQPYERRRRALAEAVARVGADLHADPVEEHATVPSQLRWWLPGTNGRLRVEIKLAPLAAGLVQTLTVIAEPTER